MTHWLKKVVELLEAETDSLDLLAKMAGFEPSIFYDTNVLTEWELEVGVGDSTPLAQLSLPPGFSTDEACEMIKHNKLPPRDWWPYIRKLDFSYSPTFDNVELLRNFKNLRYLDLTATPISSTKDLASLSRLSVLYLEGTNIVSVAYLSSCASLTDLHLRSLPISDLKPLSKLQNLRFLDVSDTDITNLSGLENLYLLEELELGNTRIQDLEPLQWLPALRYLDISFTDVSSVQFLSEISTLRDLDIAETKIDDLHLLENIEGLKINRPLSQL